MMRGLERTRSSNWIDSSDFSSFTKPKTAKRSREDDSFPKPKKANLMLDKSELWLDRHKPNLQSLAVQSKKVEETRHWILSHLKSSSILLITGPSGCGKTAMVQCLAADLGLEIQEWINPVDQVEYGRDKRSILPTIYHPDDTVDYVPQEQLFKQWLRKSRFPTLGQSRCQKIILLEDFPTVAQRSPKDFQAILETHSRTPNSPPIVVLCSDTDSSGRDSVQKNVFKAEFLEKLGIETIALNAATKTNVIKMLTRIGEEENKRGHVRFKVPDKTALENLYESTGGDVRAAINALQFSCLNKLEDFSSLFQSDESTISKKSTKSKSKKSAKSQSSVGVKDQGLVLFHGLGKILYAKRDPDPETHPLPKHLEKHRRKTLQAVPEQVFEKSAISEDGFTSFLHHNFPAFYTDIDDVTKLSAYLSESDLLLQEWGVGGKVNLKDYGVSVASRAVMFCNKNPAKVDGMRKLTKPEMYAVNRTIESRLYSVGTVLPNSCKAQPRTELFTSTLPLIASIKPKSLSANRLNVITEVGRISGVSQPSRQTEQRPNTDEEEFLSEDDELFNDLFLQSFSEDLQTDTDLNKKGEAKNGAGLDEDEDFKIEDFDDD